ncbi:GH25 family lysozyme [Ruminococcus sp.]|uniref:GH25 family lysozyme n=1 Tax=Ruminococcus sp. TaxID=41978 RepID=UPI0039931F0B
MKLQWWKRSCSVLLAAAMGYFSIGMPVQAEEVPILEEQPEQLEPEATEAIEIEADAVEDPNVDVTEGSLLQAAIDAGYMENGKFVLTFYAKKASGTPIELTDAEINYYDADGNGSIDVNDAVCFLTMYARKAVGLDPVPPEGWPLTPPNPNESDATETTTTTTTTEETTTTTTTTTTTIPITTTMTTTTTVPTTTTTMTLTTTLPTTTSTTTTAAKATTTQKTTTKASTTTAKVTTTQKATTMAGTTTATGKTTTQSGTTTATGKTTAQSGTTTATGKTTAQSGTTTATGKTTAQSGTTTATGKTTAQSGTTTATGKTTTKARTTTATTKATTTTAKTTAKPAATTTVITYATKPGIGAGAIFEGVDVSVYQGNIDWNRAKADGIEFAIMRAGYGKYVSQKDKYFDQNMKNAKAAGLPCGVYWFSYALTPEDAIKEADACYEVIKNYKLEYPVSFDMETESQMKLPKETVAQIIEAFCGRMESYGYYTTLYTYASFLNYKVEDRIFDKYDIWVAHYNTSKPAFNRNYGLWQYSCTGSVQGITGNVDRDYVYLDYERIIKNAHLNGF